MFLIKEVKGVPKNFAVEGKDTFRILPYEAKKFEGTLTDEMKREDALGWVNIFEVSENQSTKNEPKKGGKA